MELKKPNFFMRIAELSATNSTCVKKDVGAALVREGRILSTGYNGSPAGVIHCTKDSCWRKFDRDNQNRQLCRGVHAEINCIIQCALHATQIGENSVIYCTHFPCMSCAKMIINSKIRTIVFLNDYEMFNQHKMILLKESTVKIYRATKFTDNTYNFEEFNPNDQIKIIEKMNSVQ